MKKILAFILIAILSLSALVSCGDHTVTAKNVINFNLVDQDGKPVAGATVTLYRGSKKVASLVTNSVGRAEVTVAESGAYSFEFTSLPSGYEAPAERVDYDIPFGGRTIYITAKNTIPNGSKSRPYKLTGSDTIKLKSGSSLFYTVKPDGERNTLFIENAHGVTVYLGEKKYTADSRGVIEILLVDTDNLLNIRNNSPKTEFNVKLDYPHGSENNPYPIILGATCTISSPAAAYYATVADADMTLTLTLLSGEREITLYNGTTGDASSTSITVKAGEKLRIVVAEGESGVSFTVTKAE